MGAIWKPVLAFLVTAIIAVTGISITLGNVDVIAANNYLEGISAVIRESNYSEDVIAACITEAEAKGYGLHVELLGSGQAGTKGYAKVVLAYHYELAALGVSTMKLKQKIV